MATDTKAIMDPGYMADLRTAIGTCQEALDSALADLETKHEARTGLWEDAGIVGPAQTFGQLLDTFRGTTLANFIENLTTTSGNVTSYENSMSELAGAYNFNNTVGS